MTTDAPPPSPPRIPEHIARQLAVEASVCVQTIRAVHQGRSVRGLPGARALEVLTRHGYLQPTPGTP